MNEDVLYALAGIAVTFAGFSGVVVVLPLRGSPVWSPTEIRMLRLLVADSLIVLFLALLPVVLSLAYMSSEVIWRFCSALLGSWFLIGDLFAIRGELQDQAAKSVSPNPIKGPVRLAIYLLALVMGILLWLSALQIVIPVGQALYVFALMVLLGLAAAEFLFFINLLLQQGQQK